jgi:uncharacterized flavoprotein (TIGR03862 family)
MPEVAVIGGGPAGLFAAETLAAAGATVTVHEKMPSLGRKFLMAGRGGLNLTHSEGFEPFLGRYSAPEWIGPMLSAFSPGDLIAWAEGLGQQTFVGSSGRVFPRAMKASPLLRAWLGRLTELGVAFRTRSEWRGWTPDGALAFSDGQEARPDAVVLALGGASWGRLGSDGGWAALLAARGVEITPFQPANGGFTVEWSEAFRDRFAGAPLKAVALTHAGRRVLGEAVVARYGLEGGAVYALSAELRAAVPTTLTLDLRPAITAGQLTDRLSRERGGQSLSNFLRKAAGLSPVEINLLREGHGRELPAGPRALAEAIKAVPIRLTAAQGLNRAISTAGGIALPELTDRLMLRKLPGVFVAGEMLDWEAPTGGYLLQACFATGRAAALGALAQLRGAA